MAHIVLNTPLCSYQVIINPYLICTVFANKRSYGRVDQITYMEVLKRVNLKNRYLFVMVLCPEKLHDHSVQDLLLYFMANI